LNGITVQEDSPTFLSKQFPTDVDPDGKFVTIRLPHDVAEFLILNLVPFLDGLHSSVARARRRRNLDTTAIDEAKQARAALHRTMGIKAARDLRRLGSLGKGRYQAIRRLAEKYQIDHTYLAWLISCRRKTVQAYLKKRRASTMAGMYLAGASNGEIAGRLKISKGSVAKLIRENFDVVDAERQRRREATKGTAVSPARRASEGGPGSRVIGIRAARDCWRMEPFEAGERVAAIQGLAKNYGIDHAKLTGLISRRRTAVRAYVKKRRISTMARMYFDGAGRDEIAEHLNVKEGYAGWFLRKNWIEIEAEHQRQRDVAGGGHV